MKRQRMPIPAAPPLSDDERQRLAVDMLKCLAESARGEVPIPKDMFAPAFIAADRLVSQGLAMHSFVREAPRRWAWAVRISPAGEALAREIEKEAGK